uniref:Transcription factor CBF/NF-Y/archaeal histone domain-containing protein n=1 Tax=Craspedostauros australis TaxID=1486917 RepID=A0A7R9ZTN1_9STRA|mmetsp:Transcript_9889/g.26997  ORF Transcript_9889/g.26997 Transcript_9889/m.26997 type:complete len:296 (+) Transcript_9889:81-968(+)|eukprot:CAMPEP_0198121646 /NCGR_PEP_ID=MMETSP1442-20131203/32676_1 /TAXON_ID= /ORGANISM="Craspedostauros australis, Strain CCMP3328" /LENGTH=295 /DNA_ID=CAMNT_0043780491 /DNA_START=79 /DNA_END=966 /DNA_ORIENTATION=-
MVQAAAQAQAVVAAAKSRGDGLVPMNSAQINALSQIQAQAIVHARKSQGTPQQIQTQIQLQAQALVHAHTQAQIAAGIFKGEESATSSASANQGHAPARGHQSAKAANTSGIVSVTTAYAKNSGAPTSASSTKASNGLSTSMGLAQKTSSVSLVGSTHVLTSVEDGETSILPQAPAPSSNSPQFLAQLNSSLLTFWREQLQVVQCYTDQTEQDFKTHNDLPLARIKRIMKSDEDVRMISAEAPVLFAKACELFILDLSIRAWNYSQLHKRRTLQKEDIREAIEKTDVFDFLVDVI